MASNRVANNKVNPVCFHRKLLSFKGPNIDIGLNLLAPEFLHLIQINHQPDATIYQFIILTFV